MPKNRILYLDVLRGFSLLGILLVNMLSFHSPYLYIDPYKYWSRPADRFQYAVIDIFFQASFYPLFSFLFGYSLATMREKTVDLGKSFAGIAVRRLLFLMVLGALHVMLIWHGDILLIYSIVGFLSLSVLTLPKNALFTAGVFLYLIPNAFLSIFGLFIHTSGISSNSRQASYSLSNYSRGDFLDIFWQRFHDWGAANSGLSLLLIFTSIFPFFLIGASIAKGRKLPNKKHLPRLFWAFFIPGLVIKCLPYITKRGFEALFVQDVFGGPLLSVSYAIAIFMLLKNKNTKKIFSIFSHAGRMSLTNYLMQSILGTFLFYSYGLGLYGKVSIWVGTIQAAAIFLFQILFSRYLLKKFDAGPVEFVWRKFTYSKNRYIK
ncbi:DUF418 domain-containing protein [Neobacillus terrae]|uniref:DUF418 domain-containing protein n=1 Tax=Neobacillus terrae TaxID=3034837 RepID=UPI00140C9DB9|nr:DUF418 domain-containing protein [Neobacillus terrae]NHM31705.1 DUF418 domain-containing protein [Neobacillus terrae]